MAGGIKSYTLRSHKRFRVHIILVILLLFVVAGYFAAPRQVNAQAGFPGALLVPISAPITEAKEVGFFGLSFDGLSFAFANILIDQITADIVTWINTGFDGNPAFVDDLGSFAENVADQYAGAFFESNDLNWLCSPFQVKVQLALLEDYNRNNIRYACTFTEATENIENFLDGNFASGGWQSWFELTQRKENSPYGAYVVAQEELDRRIAQKLDEEETKLDRGRGFFTKEVCAIYEVCSEFEIAPSGIGLVCTKREKVGADVITEDQLDGAVCVQNKTLSPATIIEGQLQQVLPAGLRRIEIADELSEIFTALITQLLTEVLTGDEGLRGATEFIEEVGIGTVVGGPTGSLDCNGGSPGSSTVTKTVDSFEITQGNREMQIGLGLDGHYPHVEASFDFFLGPEINPDGRENWQSVFMIRPVAAPPGRGGWFNNLTIMDRTAIMNMIGNGSDPVDDWTNVNANWTLNHWYRVTLLYDAGVEARIEVTDRDSGAGVATMSAVPGNSIYPLGGGTSLFLGSEAKPLIGSKIEGFTLTLEPGEAVCGGVSGGGPGGPGGPPIEI